MSTAPSTVIGPDLRAALVAMVRRRVPESEVEDIVQSTLADALESPHAPQDSDSLRRWIFGVAKNKVVDYHRRAGRESFDMPEVAGKPAPHAEADLLRWAEKHLPPGEENKTTLDWMLREGDGEKLEWIAETERVPAPRVRQRVSRLRRHLKEHWQKEAALLAALGIMLTVLVVLLRKSEPEPIANEDVKRAEELRKVGLEKCRALEWAICVEKLDDAKRLDPAGDTKPAIQHARDDAKKALAPVETPPPAPTLNDIKSPAPSPSPSPTPSMSGFPLKMKAPPDAKDQKTFKPVKPMETSAPPVPKAPTSSKGRSSKFDGFEPSDSNSDSSIPQESSPRGSKK